MSFIAFKHKKKLYRETLFSNKTKQISNLIFQILFSLFLYLFFYLFQWYINLRGLFNAKANIGTDSHITLAMGLIALLLFFYIDGFGIK